MYIVYYIILYYTMLYYIILYTNIVYLFGPDVHRWFFRWAFWKIWAGPAAGQPAEGGFQTMRWEERTCCVLSHLGPELMLGMNHKFLETSINFRDPDLRYCCFKINKKQLILEFSSRDVSRDVLSSSSSGIAETVLVCSRLSALIWADHWLQTHMYPANPNPGNL